MNNLKNKLVLVTGGTQGIGLETVRAFAKAGADIIATYHFGSADIDALEDEFKQQGGSVPRFIQSDIGNDEDIDELLTEIKQTHQAIEVFVSNVAFGAVVNQIENYSEKDLYNSIRYSTWPLFGVTLKIKELFATYPRYAIGISSYGSEKYLLNYDLLAVCKNMMESMIRYFNYHVFEEDIRINVVRPQFVDTQSLAMTMGKDFAAFAKKYATPGLVIDPKLVADTIFILCSGLLDGVRGQVLELDQGSAFADNIMRYYESRKQFGME